MTSRRPLTNHRQASRLTDRDGHHQTQSKEKREKEEEEEEEEEENHIKKKRKEKGHHQSLDMNRTESLLGHYEINPRISKTRYGANNRKGPDERPLKRLAATPPASRVQSAQDTVANPHKTTHIHINTNIFMARNMSAISDQSIDSKHSN